MSRWEGFIEKSEDIELRITHPEVWAFIFTSNSFLCDVTIPVGISVVYCRDRSHFLRPNKHLKFHIHKIEPFSFYFVEYTQELINFSLNSM
jgi:hypothetical protein